MIDKEEITYIVDMFCATLKLPMETLEQPFIPLAYLDYIKPFFKILGYQGSLNKGTNRTPRATRTPNPVEVVQNRKRKRKQATRETSLPIPSLKVRIKQQKPTSKTPFPLKQQNLAAVEKQILDEDAKKLVERAKESSGTKFVDIVLLSDEDSSDSLEPKSHNKNPKKNDDDDDDENKDDKKDDDDNDDDDNDDDDHDYHALIRTQVMGSSEIRTENMEAPMLSPLDPLGLAYL
uniref:Uncharacterized protein n=1 Tax=Tanacetum cinerariifolium TaxID=118510 RepID=A0A6L2JE66_TANCI|nr:hypothetical protein [Tanacetum cinerariifolium]